jgi:hypothetical protein
MTGERCHVQRQMTTVPAASAAAKQPMIRALPQPPFLALDDAKHQSRDRDCEQQRAQEVGNPSAARRPALYQPPPGQQHRGHTDREVYQEHQAPVCRGDKQAADHGAEAGGGRTDRGEQRDAVGTMLRRECIQN